MRFVWMGCDVSKCQSSNILCALDKPGTDDAECRKKVASGRQVAGAIRALVSARDLQFAY